MTLAPLPRSSERPTLAVVVTAVGGVTLAVCIAWAISRTSGLSNVSVGNIGVALAVLTIGLVPFVVLALGAVTLGRAVTLVATTLFALVFIAAYLPSSDSATGGGAIGHPVRACTILLVIAACGLIGASEGVRKLHRHRFQA
jgi:hypothetical protein